MNTILTIEDTKKQKQVKISGKSVTLVFNKQKPGSAAIIAAKDMLTNSYANSIFSVAKTL